MAEDLTQHLAELGLRVRDHYGEVEALERTAILVGLWRATFDVPAGIKLSRGAQLLPDNEAPMRVEATYPVLGFPGTQVAVAK